MSNWFENNASKSVIAYTILIGGATWAISTFILKDNRLGLAQSQLESQIALTEQYKSKVDLLQRDIELIRSENTEYRQWLGEIKDAIPAIAPRIINLKGDIARLEAEVTSLRAENPHAASTPVEHSASLGSAFIDEATGLIFTVKKTTPERMATVLVHFPESGSAIESEIDPGKRWEFKANNKKYRLTVTEITFILDTVRFRIEQVI
ncbi:hypothetical protein [Stenotrophomonas sp.]|uniref:hypothetical protein n=1 Tax=Stenotrophomonas sp. TaxID=69392 RepID=UPI0028A73886|nr:hypothetical protein [Stenotrophomonas sp.]